jgi:hypothetical protein
VIFIKLHCFHRIATSYETVELLEWIWCGNFIWSLCEPFFKVVPERFQVLQFGEIISAVYMVTLQTFGAVPGRFQVPKLCNQLLGLENPVVALNK